MRIADLLRTEAPPGKQPPPLTCGQTVENAARRMERSGQRLLPICRKDGSVAGVISERDIVVKVVARSRAPGLCSVDEVMNTRLLFCKADDPVERVRRLFESSGVTCAVVTDARGRLAGVVEAAALSGLLHVAGFGRSLRSRTPPRSNIESGPEWPAPAKRSAERT